MYGLDILSILVNHDKSTDKESGYSPRFQSSNFCLNISICHTQLAITEYQGSLLRELNGQGMKLTEHSLPCGAEIKNPSYICLLRWLVKHRQLPLFSISGLLAEALG
jgi:hypothetical protein